MKQKVYFLVQMLLIPLIISAQSLAGVKENLNQEAPGKKVDVVSVNKVTSGSNNIVCDLFCQTPYIAGSTMDLVFKLIKDQNDSAMIDQFTLDFPIGITPNSTPNLTFPSSPAAGSPANLNLPISGQIVSWGSESNDNFGGINTTSVGVTFTVNVTIDPTLTGLQTVSYYASNDSYGSSTWPGLITEGLIYDVFSPNIDFKTEIIDVVNFYNCTFDTDSIHVKVTNNGSTTESNIIVHYEINGTLNSIDTIFNSLSPGDFKVIAFAPPFALSPINHVYNIKAWSYLVNDTTLNNDTAIVTVPYPSPYNLYIENYTNGFETEYETGSVNLDFNVMGIPFNISQTNFHSGSQALFLTLAGTFFPVASYEVFANLPCIDLVQSTIYKISYWRKSIASGTLTTNGETGIFMGSGQDAASMTYTLKPYSPIGTTTLTGTNGWVQDYVVFNPIVTGTYYFSIGGKGVINNTSDRINIRIDDIEISIFGYISGINTLVTDNITSIFPNPTTGILNVNATEISSSIKIFNVIGDEIYTSQLLKGNNSIDLSNFSKGVYFVKLNSNGQNTTQKIILDK